MNHPVPVARQAALHLTETVANALLQGIPPASLPTVHAPFPPQFAADERLWAVGPFRLHDFRALGDGTYMQDQSWAFGTGVLGVGLMAATWGTRIIGNNRRRAEAEAAMVPRWVEIDAGELHAGTHGFYLRSPQGFGAWSWPSIFSAEMLGPGWLRFDGDARHGPVNWSVVSDWAELLFLTWAAARHPQHPQLVNGTWWPGIWRSGPPTLPSS